MPPHQSERHIAIKLYRNSPPRKAKLWDMSYLQEPLHERKRPFSPRTDLALLSLWTSFEGALRDRFPGSARMIATPSWNDLDEKVDRQ
jgi:hypothetical protein